MPLESQHIFIQILTKHLFRVFAKRIKRINHNYIKPDNARFLYVFFNTKAFDLVPENSPNEKFGKGLHFHLTFELLLIVSVCDIGT